LPFSGRHHKFLTVAIAGAKVVNYRYGSNFPTKWEFTAPNFAILGETSTIRCYCDNFWSSKIREEVITHPCHDTVCELVAVAETTNDRHSNQLVIKHALQHSAPLLRTTKDIYCKKPSFTKSPTKKYGTFIFVMTGKHRPNFIRFFFTVTFTDKLQDMVE